MSPFRSSLPGRIISASVAFALISGGLIAVLGLDPPRWLPFSLLIPIVGCFVGTVLSVASHSGTTLALAVLLPVLFWPYTLALMLITNSYRQYGWLLLGAGIVLAGMTALSGVVRVPERRVLTRESLA